MKISEILDKYGTCSEEKGTDKNFGGKNGHCYGKAYDKIFANFKQNDELDIIEVGTEYGKSLLAWREFFPNANIAGIDIEDKVENKIDDIEYIITNIKDFEPKKEYDIVIDDGSHKLDDVIQTVRKFKLKEGGVMIIEDCQKPDHWFEEIKKNTNYSIEIIDLRKVNGKSDDYLIVLRNYNY